MPNRNLLAYLLMLILFTILVFLIYEGCKTYFEAEASAQESCVFSLQGYLAESLKKEEIQKTINPNKEWKLLNNTERGALLNSLDKKFRVNCGKISFFDENEIQSRNDLQILVRQTDKGMEVSIHSLQ